MAFQIKKDLHLDIGIYLELLDNLTNAKVSTDNFDNTKYTIPIKCIGNDITEGGGIKWFQDKDTKEWVTLKVGKSTDMELTQSQYERLVKYEKGSKVQVTMKELQGAKGKYTGIEVKPLNGVAFSDDNALDAFADKGTDKPVKVVSNGSLEITWCMCVKEATKIVIAKNTPSPNTFEDIEYFTKGLMDVAIDGLERWKQQQHEKDQNSEPNDDDVPF